MKHFYVNVRLLLFLLLISGLASRAKIITPFSSSYHTTEKGGASCLWDPALHCSSHSSTSTGACANDAMRDLPARETMPSNGISTTCADIDGNPSTSVPGSSDLNPPACNAANRLLLLNPVPVDDNITTVIGTTVSGNAAANDTGTSGATFSIVGQPANGTVTIDPATGLFTYTPPPTFTGVTTATYNLCGGAPVSCSTAVIHVTVYPGIVANPDIITTLPLVTTTGSLLANDSGITPGGTYSVSFTQIPIADGVLTVDPATGNYTFSPATLFTGSVATTYTVCNIGVIPAQCAVTTITILVGIAPLAVSDGTTTVINTPVGGNAATNDSGTILGTFYFGSPGSGTLTGNSVTGTYTFTPAPGFTGTTQATYTLCNLIVIPCSSATITFTVYPTLTAVPDVINTSPSVTATGTLLANDIGLTPGESYSVTFTPVSPTNGTLTVNPATGQYTLTPNPTFTGQAVTSYTVCNISVNPNQCSSAGITVNVLPHVVAVNDNIATAINTSVSANAGANDLGTTGSTFAIVSQPANGTVTINSATGQYTYTPPATFTGVTTATYNLCGGAPVSCSAAVISITVYPILIAVNDVINTTPLTPKTGSLLSNDTGVTPGGSYSVSVTQLPGGTGTLAVNPVTGQYTFTPASSFTGTAQTTYTVCNTVINPQQCSSATISIFVSSLPFAVNDGTATIINTPVSGSAGANDSGTLAATFNFGSVTAGTGTLTGNSLTGIYSFTPASGFTGTTIATYTLCDPLSVGCVTASITFTVYPTLVAVPDLISTSPLVTATGALLANDLGITPGASYSVSVTPLLSVTGTLSVNPVTGICSFTPNPSFTGTTQTSYTVCNVSVNPQQCSSASISINVSPNPIPVDDHLTTIMNTSVSGDASANDVGATGGTFAIVAQPLSGNITMSANGQFTFTPVTNFVGVATATYQLCNGSPATCSTAVITITVYPVLTAHDDVISTTPSVTATGSLLANDTGIVPGGSYSVGITPPAPGTGTLLVNPVTGNYTFTPAPAFTGTAQASYTVCNNSLVPQICSSATISILVGFFPVAVNDFTETVQQTPVSGNVGANDSFTVNGTFSFGNAGSAGSFSGNGTTGDYTFTPATGFSGTVGVSYTLCTPYSPPCSSAVITITVYPSLQANADLITTMMSSSVTGNFEINDTGLTGGATYSLSTAALSASVGVLAVNASSGQYSFTPAAGYTGTTVTNYTLAQVSGSTQLQSSIANVTIVVTNTAIPSNGSPVGIAKSVSNVTYSNNATFSLTYKLVVKNYGTQPLGNVAVSDDLSQTFPLPATFTITGAPALQSTGSQLTLAGNFNGNGNNQLTLPSSSSLAPGHADTLLFTVTVDPHYTQATYNNFALVAAVMNNANVADSSANGINPDPDGDSNPGNNTSPTTFSINLVKIGISKWVHHVTPRANGCFDVTFQFTVKNYGTSPIYNVKVIDDLNTTFGTTSYSVVAPVTSLRNYLIPDNSYNGSTQTNLISGSSQLAAGSSDTLWLEVRYCVSSAASFSNIAMAYGTSLPSGGFIGYDMSWNGLDPDPSHNNNPEEWGNTVFGNGRIGLPEEFMIPEGFSPNSDGINDRFEIKGLSYFPELELTIINRWGTTVYNKKQYDNTWDGTSNTGVRFGGQELPQGTYFYIADLGDGSKPRTGFIYLNRAVR